MAVDKLISRGFSGELRLLIARMVSCFALGIAPANLLAQTPCRGPDSTSTRIVAEILRYSTATAGDDLKVRTALNLPLTSQVALVTNKTTCTKAQAAFATEFASQGSAVSSAVYVVSVGTVYAVVDPQYRYNNVARPGAWPFVYFVDSKFKKLSVFAG